jgi:hypothetical protein
VLLAVWSLGGCQKVTKRNFARAYLVMLALFIGLGIWGFTVLKGIYRDIFVLGNLPANSPAAGVIEYFGEKATGALINRAARRAIEQSGESLTIAEQTADLSVIAALALAQDREGLRNLGFSEDAIEGLLAAAKTQAARSVSFKRDKTLSQTPLKPFLPRQATSARFRGVGAGKQGRDRLRASIWPFISRTV